MIKKPANNTRFEQANYFLEGSAFGVADNTEYFWNEEDSDKELWNDEEKSADKKNKDNSKQAKDKSDKLDEASSNAKVKKLKADIDQIQDYITGAEDAIHNHKKSGNDALLAKAENKLEELKSRLSAAKKKLNDHIKATSVEDVSECTEKTKGLKKITSYAESVISAAKEDATLCEALLKNFNEVSLERVATKVLKEMDQSLVQNSLRSIYKNFKKYGTIPEIVNECEDAVDECNKELSEDAGPESFEFVYDSFLNGDYEPMLDEITDASSFGKFVAWVSNVAKASDETLSDLVRHIAHKIR